MIILMPNFCIMDDQYVCAPQQRAHTAMDVYVGTYFDKDETKSFYRCFDFLKNQVNTRTHRPCCSAVYSSRVWTHLSQYLKVKRFSIA